MELSDKIMAVARMQRYIIDHLDEKITPDALARAAGYSKHHAPRVFRELTNLTPAGYIRALRLTGAAQTLRDSSCRVVDIALESGFDSHDSFTRAFARQFAITPQSYRRQTPPVPYFVHYPVEAYYQLKGGNDPMEKEKVPGTVTVTAVERPARKLILLRAQKTTGGDYFAFCEEMGCESEGLLNSIPEKFDTAALLTLPSNLIKPGTTDTAAGVEVPADYSKPVPEGYDIIDLPPCALLYFQGSPYQDEQDFGIAIGIVWRAMDAYQPERYGWRYAPELAPRFNLGAGTDMGARMAVPVRKI